MADHAQTRRTAVIALLLGVGATGLVLLAHLGGLDRRAELYALDVRLRHADTLTPSGRILHIDIDDRSREEVGRWPWPREYLAALICTLDAAGAETVAMDIILPRPQPVRYVNEADDLYALPAADQLGQGPPVPVFDDAVLTEAIARCGRVFVPMYLSLGSTAGRDAVFSRINALLTETPDASLQSVLEALQARSDLPQTTRLQETIQRAYLAVRAIAALGRFALPEDIAQPLDLPAGPVVPPLLPFAQAAAGSGFVSIEPDVDGVLRRVPLLARGDGKTWPQFALALAAERLGLSLQSDMQVTGGQLLLRPDRTDGVAIPVDGRGQMIVRWPAPEKKTRISAAAIMHVWREQQTLERIDTLTHALRIGVLSLGYPPDEHREAFMELGELTGQLDRAYQQRVDLQRRQQRTILYRPGQQIDPDELDQALRREQQLDQAVRLQARSLLTALREGDALDAFIQDRQADQANRLLGLLDALPAERRVIVNNLASLKRELSERVGGKLCLIGSTSSGGADFVPTPVNKRTPGVDLHAAVLETILSGRFIQRAPTGVNVLVILLGGLVVSLISATRSAVVSIAATLLLAGGYALGCFYLVFGWGGVWLEAMAPLAAMFAAILAVTVYRQLTEERARRRIRAMFAHALSPQLVDRLIEDPSIAALGGQNRPISCLFSDLAGFTRLSGQIGPQRTVQLLNRYFDVVTAIIQQRYEGYINKFLGDGVFAFFGAPVDQGDHPTRAIQAAIDYLRAMDPLNDQLAEQFEATARLRVRIGITSQEAMVGNCGSSSRMDYTAIGECVNLASRLESANKVFGTQCLVDDRAWQQADHGGLIARPMGRLVISGIAEPVRPWHVLGRRDELDAATIEQTELFAEAMDRLESRDFATAAERLDQLAEYDDPAIRIYVRLVREAMASPDGEHFQPEPLHSGCVERIILPD